MYGASTRTASISEKHIELKLIEYIDLGRMDYGQCWDLQRSVFDAMLTAKVRGGRATAGSDGSPMNEPTDATTAKLTDESAADPTAGEKVGTLFLVEHPPVYTLGKNGKISNLLLDEERLRACGAEFYRIDRGGDITFHGEGQIVGYPILDLERLGIGLREYIAAIEQSVIDTVAEYGLRAGRLAGASGVWLGEGVDFGKGGDFGGEVGDGGKAETDSGAECGAENGGGRPDADPQAARRKPAGEKGALRKICAIGVRASRFITMHGFALNVSTDLSCFDVINPCGFTDKGATSMARELGYAPDMEEVKRKLTEHLSENLNVKIYKN